MNVKVILGCLLALIIGTLCRLSGIPLPAPVALLGGVLVMAMTAGYSLVDRYAGHCEHRPEQSCGESPGTQKLEGSDR